MIYVGGEIELRSSIIKRNIILKANNKIEVEDGCELEEVILYAPKILIKGSVKGNFQAIATQKIEVGKNAALAYPTLICTLNTGDNRDSTFINIDRGAEIDGLVLGWKEQNTVVPLMVNIKPEAKITGQVFTNGIVNMQGTVTGNITTERLVLSDGNVWLGNFLYNSKIDRCALSDDYLSPFFHTIYSNEQIVKCLY